MKIRTFLVLTLLLAFTACARDEVPENMVLVEGGMFVNNKSNLYDKNIVISDFYICKYEVTQKEWTKVMKKNPSTFINENAPVEGVTWYDCIEYCNRISEKEGLEPYYEIDKTKKDENNLNKSDNICWTVKIKSRADGYRLPTEEEWEYAAGGGQNSDSYTYSGSNDLNDVGWFWVNSGDKLLKDFWNYTNIKKNNCRTKPVGIKAPNELGLYDMSGNVREWCWDWSGDHLNMKKGENRVIRGGGWLGADYCCKIDNRMDYAPYLSANDTGFRVCLNR